MDTAQQIVDRLLEAEVNPADLWKSYLPTEWTIEEYDGNNGWASLQFRGRQVAAWELTNDAPSSERVLDKIREAYAKHSFNGQDVFAWMTRWGLTDSEGNWLF